MYNVNMKQNETVANMNFANKQVVVCIHNYNVHNQRNKHNLTLTKGELDNLETVYVVEYLFPL